MALHLAHFGHDHAGKRRRCRDHVLDLETSHGEGMRKFVGAQRGIDILAQPVFRELHGGSP